MTLELASGAPIVCGVLGVGTIGVWLSARREFVMRLLSFAAATPVLLIASSIGRPGAVALVVVLALVCCWEYARMTQLGRTAQIATTIAVIGLIAASAAHVHVSFALLVLATAGPSLMRGRVETGMQNTAYLGWGVAWLGSALSVLPGVGALLLPIAVAVSIGDVAAYFGGSLARRHAARYPWLAVRLSPLSPNKTWAGALVGAVSATATLAVFGAVSLHTIVAVTIGAVLGDLLESMIKRGCGVKDAGAWLPGFGGLLDRVDSLLGALLIFGALT